MVKTRSNKNYINVLNSADARSVSVSMAIEQSTSTAVPPPEKKLRNMILREIWNEISLELETRKETSSYGIITNILKKNKVQFPWLTRNMINYFKKINLPPDVVNLSNGSAVSPTSDLTNVNNAINLFLLQAILNSTRIFTRN